MNQNHADVNVNLMEENIIQIRSGIMINFDVRLKYTIYIYILYKIIFGILLHEVVKSVNI